MIDNEKIREIVVTGLREYLGIPVIRGNQNAEPPDYPYVSYNIITLESANNGTYGEYKDGVDRIPVTQTWSISIQSNKYDESITLASKAREFLCHTGSCYLNDNNVIVQKVGEITNRDNLISIDYEYKNGFDAVFWLMREAKNPMENSTIEKIHLEEER